jgi:cyclophilin family peptidyl-prolyl cis-trans isomerase
VLAQLQKELPDDIRIVFRHFPLASIHDKALLATQAAEAAGQQGKFWQMHDYLFENQASWSQLSVDEFNTWLLEDAVPALELDVERFRADVNSDEMAAFAQTTWELGQAMGLPGTPYFALNGSPYNGPLDSGSMAVILQLLKLKDIQFTQCPSMQIDPLKQYIATIQTQAGNIVLELFPDVAPLAVNSFVFLAQHGWFDGVTFHRVIPGFMAQAGDPTGTGIGGPGYAFKNETTPDLVFDRAGLLAMANSGPDTNGSQFFITYGPAEHLNGSYTIFGEVIEGMYVVESLTPRNPQEGGDLPPGDEIISITIEER